MTPAQLLARIQKRAVPPALLLLGPEAYQRQRIKEAHLPRVKTLEEFDYTQSPMVTAAQMREKSALRQRR